MDTDKTFKTPDITTGQITTGLAGLGAIVAVVEGAPERLQVPLLLVVGVVASAYLISDAVIRYGRATGNASKD